MDSEQPPKLSDFEQIKLSHYRERRQDIQSNNDDAVKLEATNELFEVIRKKLLAGDYLVARKFRYTIAGKQRDNIADLIIFLKFDEVLTKHGPMFKHYFFEKGGMQKEHIENRFVEEMGFPYADFMVGGMLFDMNNITFYLETYDFKDEEAAKLEAMENQNTSDSESEDEATENT